jgi:isopropylmalate/homocitrate/citramalate synthase
MNTPWKTDKWFTSHLNFDSEVRSSLQFAPHIQLHDVSLRDGEQQTGLIFSVDEKVRIARMLDEVGIHRIEAGMPAVSPQDAEAITKIAKLGLRAKVFGFSRCIPEEIKRVADCGVQGVVIEIPASKHLIQYAYRWPLEKAIELSVAATRCAKEQGLYTVFFTIDGTRTDFDWYVRLIDSVAKDGHMDALAVVDTFGTLMPTTVPFYIRRLKQRVSVPLEIHFHDDFGCGVANTLLALANGAEVAHTTVTSIGERAGNVAYEELALALLTCYGVNIGLRFDKMCDLSMLVRDIGDVAIPSNRPVVGDLLFQIESGIIATWFLNCGNEHMLEVFPYLPSLVGQQDAGIVLGKNSGLDSVRHWLERSNGSATEEELQALLARVKERAYELHGLLSTEDFLRLARKSMPKSVPAK